LSTTSHQTKIQFLFIAGNILAQDQIVEKNYFVDEELQRAKENDRKLAELQQKEATLRKQKDAEMTNEEYSRWQQEFDEINQQIVDILCNQNIVEESD
jgi:hypothetical protein